MAREWQQTRMTDYIMPNAVYYQSLWAVRDLDRMEQRVKEIDVDSSKSSSVVKEKTGKYIGSNKVEERALEHALLTERIENIRKALSTVPPKYRSYVLSNIIFQNPGYTFPDKLWRIWKQRFLYNVAKNLALM